jgi:hypothetical protein
MYPRGIADRLPRAVATWFILAVCTVLVSSLAGCNGESKDTASLAGSPPAERGSGDDLLPVDCRLPGQIRQLGQMATYISRRPSVKTSASDCRIRGGEYVAYDRADYATALKVWLPEAQKGDAEAQTYVGEIYQKGMGLAPDHTLAAAWYQKAANQGYSAAQINLGLLYEQGLGVTQDRAKALEWYRRASGLPEGQIQVASVDPNTGRIDPHVRTLG